jgi:hypothetical protein
VNTKKAGDPDEARARAESKFRKQEHLRHEGEKVWAEQAATAKKADDLRAKLRAQRLAKEASGNPSAEVTAAKPARDAKPKRANTTLKPDKKVDARKEAKIVKPGQ